MPPPCWWRACSPAGSLVSAEGWFHEAIPRCSRPGTQALRERRPAPVGQSPESGCVGYSPRDDGTSSRGDRAPSEMSSRRPPEAARPTSCAGMSYLCEAYILGGGQLAEARGFRRTRARPGPSARRSGHGGARPVAPRRNRCAGPARKGDEPPRKSSLQRREDARGRARDAPARRPLPPGVGTLYRRTGDGARGRGASRDRDDDVPRDGHAASGSRRANQELAASG